MEQQFDVLIDTPLKKKCSVNILNIIAHKKYIKSNAKGFILTAKIN